MDASKQTSSAINADRQFAAEVVRDIGKIERGYRLAEGPMSERLMEDVALLMRATAEEPWNVAATDYSVLLTHPDWKSNRPLGRGDMWIEFTEICPEGDESTWITAAVGQGSAHLGFELGFRIGLQPVAKSILQDEKTKAALRKLGLQSDGAAERNFFPIKVDGKRLEKGFENDDLSDALATIRSSFAKLIAAKDEFDSILEIVREKAKAA